MSFFLIFTVLFAEIVAAVGGARLTSGVHSYTAGTNATAATSSGPKILTGGSYEHTGFGSAESAIEITNDGTLIFTPAFSGNETGYVTSKDNGKTWSFIIPQPNQARMQPMFNIHDGRYFYWSSNAPGLQISYSDDQGVSWKNLGNHFQMLVQDWAKMISGKPVRSQLINAREIMYLSAPSLVSVPIAAGLGPRIQLIAKSVDHGITWVNTKGAPTLLANNSGGACAALPKNIQNQEYLIWGNGLVRPNGTVVFGLRRCRSLSLAISDDEGDSWHYSDVPGSALVPYDKGILTYVLSELAILEELTCFPSWQNNGNVLAADPISQDTKGNLYAIWVDGDYSLKLSRSNDGATTWTKPVVISAPIGNSTRPMMTYHPILIHHPTASGRAAIAYYGSPDGGATWNGYVAETLNVHTDIPSFSGFVANEASTPLQKNVDGHWDQGYQNPLADLIEFTGLRYHPKTGDLVAAFARKMCRGIWAMGTTFNTSSCQDGWDFITTGKSLWQGYTVFGHH
jgi:hypothetical protein